MVSFALNPQEHASFVLVNLGTACCTGCVYIYRESRYAVGRGGDAKREFYGRCVCWGLYY